RYGPDDCLKNTRSPVSIFSKGSRDVCVRRYSTVFSPRRRSSIYGRMSTATCRFIFASVPDPVPGRWRSARCLCTAVRADKTLDDSCAAQTGAEGDRVKCKFTPIHHRLQQVVLAHVLRAVISTFDVDIGANGLDQSMGGWFAEDHEIVDRLELVQNVQSLRLRIDGPAFTLELGNL